MAFAYFDTLKYVKLLEEADFTPTQAKALNEAQIMAMHMVLQNVSTQENMRDLRQELKAEIQQFRFETRAEFQQFRVEMQTEFQQFRVEMQTDFQQFRVEMQTELHKTKNFILQSTITIIAAISVIIGLALAAIPLLI